MYAEGRGVPQDFTEAVKWYRLPAERGHPQAQYNLALSYAKGEGVLQDYVSAHMWFNLAAAYFPASEVHNQELAARNRAVVANKMTHEQIAEAQNLAREWEPRSARRGRCEPRGSIINDSQPKITALRPAGFGARNPAIWAAGRPSMPVCGR
jgi:TPR repeat protein